MIAISHCTFDANILIYALDESAGFKRLIAKEIVSELAATQHPIVPLQTLSEFYRATTRSEYYGPTLREPLSQSIKPFGRFSRQAVKL